MTPEELKIEKLKIVYDKVAEHHKYYLTWRQVLLAGYFVIIGMIFYSIYSIIENNSEFQKICFIVILSIAFISWLFLELDKRNRDLYHICQRVGSKIESEFFENLDPKIKDNFGLFFTLDKSQENSSYYTHSKLIDILYKTNLIIVLLSIYLFITKTI